MRLVTLLLVTPSLFGQGIVGDVISSLGKSDKKDKSPSAQATQQIKLIEEEDSTFAFFQEITFFSEGLYHRLEGRDGKSSSALKIKVDRAVEQQRRGDMERAFRMNTSSACEVKAVAEDQMRICSGIYENPVVQALVNRVGQSVIPRDVPVLYSFKLVVDPVPYAEALSTGTIWVSTGMVALVNSKPELAYVLAHEAAHIYLQHHRRRILLSHAQDEYNRQLAANGEIRAKRNTFWWGAAGVGLGTLIGKAAGDNGVAGAVLGGLAGAAAGGIYATATNPRLTLAVDWNRWEEDEADRLALQWMMKQNLDFREVPKIYHALRDAGDRDPRVTLGFLGKTDRVRERLKAIEDEIRLETLKPEFASRIWERADPDFDLVLAEVKRDNGVHAYFYDMHQTARSNLKAAVAIKTKDPTALYFYGKALAQTARTDEERVEAETYFRLASESDYRNQNFGSHLHRAVSMLTRSDQSVDKKQAVDFLKRYLLGYHFFVVDSSSGNVKYPPHLNAVYDYLAREGEFRWTFDAKSIEKAAAARANGTPIMDYSEKSEGTLADSSPGEASQTTQPKANMDSREPTTKGSTKKSSNAKPLAQKK
jgi:Zn-dependent protease with chaperone function